MTFIFIDYSVLYESRKKSVSRLIPIPIPENSLLCFSVVLYISHSHFFVWSLIQFYIGSRTDQQVSIVYRKRETYKSLWVSILVILRVHEGFQRNFYLTHLFIVSTKLLVFYDILTYLQIDGGRHNSQSHPQ